MADKEIINAADLEDPIKTTKKYLTMNRKIWTKTHSNHSSLTVPSSTLPIFSQSVRNPVSRKSVFSKVPIDFHKRILKKL